VIRGIGRPAAAVGFCVREEWAATLEDLIERRLMLSFHERLSREAIADVAESMVAVGALPQNRVEAAIDGCMARLESRYGRHVRQTISVMGPAGGARPAET
jgi:glycerol-3-phosphate dehydrogenase